MSRIGRPVHRSVSLAPAGIPAWGALLVVAGLGSLLNLGLSAWGGELALMSPEAWVAGAILTYLLNALCCVIWPRLAPATALAVPAGTMVVAVLAAPSVAGAAIAFSLPLTLVGILGAMAGKRRG